MQSNHRTLWIFVGLVAIGLCLCAAAAVIIGMGVITLPRVGIGIGTTEGARIDRTFDLGASPTVDVNNFSGGVTVRAGAGTTIQVIAVKRALTRSTRDNIEVDMTEQAGSLVIKTQRPSALSSGSVDLDITAPAGARLTLHTGSGGVTVEDITGSVTVDTGSGGIELRGVPAVTDAHTGSGGIDVQGAAGPIRLQTGSGGIEYQGSPQGECRFQTGSGGIVLSLPADLSVSVDLSTGSGRIQLGYEVAGSVSPRQVQGNIGSGEQGSIYAHTGSGSIDLRRQ